MYCHKDRIKYQKMNHEVFISVEKYIVIQIKISVKNKFYTYKLGYIAMYWKNSRKVVSQSISIMIRVRIMHKFIINTWQPWQCTTSPTRLVCAHNLNHRIVLVS